MEPRARRRDEPVLVTGPRYLELATGLLHQIRLARPAGGIWEAADMQWWSRQERPTDGDGQLFWLDARGQPEAAVIRTAFGRSVQCDVLVLPDEPVLARTAWRAGLDRAAATGAPTEFPVEPDDLIGRSELEPAGYGPARGTGLMTSWLAASDRLPVPPLPRGYRLLSRAEDSGRPHPMIARNGSQVEQRLSGCSLYRPELDLVVRAPDGQPAGYGLFWADSVTGVGLVEPMRTEDAYQGRGIASHVLAAGLELLADLGCQHLKVSNDLGLYRRAGFRLASIAPIYARPVITMPAAP
jgi:GNAT superfamily N-acetyltransferase